MHKSEDKQVDPQLEADKAALVNDPAFQELEALHEKHPGAKRIFTTTAGRRNQNLVEKAQRTRLLSNNQRRRLFPEQKEYKAYTPDSDKALAAAEAKRQRKIQKRRGETK